jgi:hypothetical protein
VSQVRILPEALSSSISPIGSARADEFCRGARSTSVKPLPEETTMSVFTRHRNGASDSVRTSRYPCRSSVDSRMRDHRDRLPVTVAGTRLSV